MKPAPQPLTARGSRRLLWAGLILLTIGWLLAGSLWWGIPALLQSQLPPRLSQALGRPVSLTAVRFEPRHLALLLQGLRIGPAGAATGEPLLLAEQIRVELAIGATLRHLAPVIGALAVDGLRLRLARTAAGHYDIDDLIQRLNGMPPDDASTEPVRFALRNLAVRDAEIRFDDRPSGKVHRLQALNLALPLLSNLPDDAATPAEPHLAFTLDGARVDAGAHALLFAAKRSGELVAAVGDLDLQPWLGYLPAGLPIQLRQGRLGAQLRLHFDHPPQGAPMLRLQGQLSLRDVALAEPDGTPLATWRALALDLRDLQPLQRTLSLGTLRIDGAELQIARDARGGLNLQHLRSAANATDSPGEPKAAAATSPWRIELAALQIDGARVRWHDAAVRPAADYTLDPLTLELRDLRWPLQAAMPLTARIALHPGTGPPNGRSTAGQLRVDGSLGDRQAQLALTLEALDLDALRPYLAQALRPRLSGRLAAQAQLRWALDPAALAITIDTATLTGLQLRDGKARAATPLASVQQARLAGATIDLNAHALDVARLQITQPLLALSRRADGQLDAAQWLPPTAPPPAARRTTKAPKAPKAPPWRVALRDLSLDGGRLHWTDAAVAGPTADGPLRADLAALKLRLQGFAWPAAARTPRPRLQLSASVGAPASRDAPPGSAPERGDIDWSGRIGLAPLQAEGRLKLHRLPLHLAAPYAGDALPVHLQHADLSLQTQLQVQSTPAGWQLATDGELQLTELSVHTNAPVDGVDDELLRWQSLSLQGLVLALAPPAKPRVEVRELALNDFYSRLVITEQGRFNLRDLRPGDAGSAEAAPVPAKPPVATPSSRAAPRPDEELPIDLVLGPTQLHNGRIDFSDHFIRPNYSARLTELNGSIGALRSGTREMATISLHGRAADTAIVDINGRINPTARPLALDIQARATDLELAPFSPYAGKYAGYAIERGKLSMDVAYKIDADGKLDARNQVILNQLTFGERVESPSATHLPVLLAVALLKDRHGVIDINLPISGSVNDPQFSLGGLIWKVIVNLLGRALTAPFSLLAGAGTDDLSQVGFVPGTARVTESGAQSLKRVAQALTERPGLSMTVTGMADLSIERDEARRVTLDQQLQAEARRERLRAAPAAGAATSAPAATAVADLPPLAAADRARLLKRLYQQAPLPDKPRNAIGLLRELPADEMQARLVAAIPVTEDSMRELALQRGLAVRDALIAEGLPSARLFLAAPKLHAPGPDGAAWAPQVTLTLSAK